MSLRVVKETNIGVYVALSFGIPIDDGDGHVLSIPSRENDRQRIGTLIVTAKAYGYDNVSVNFIAGVRKIDDDEYEVQQQRLEAGLVPDVNELGSAMDDYREGTKVK